jgi:hypothetical protein
MHFQETLEMLLVEQIHLVDTRVEMVDPLVGKDALDMADPVEQHQLF